MTEADSRTPDRFKFRIASLLWLMLVVAAFIGGIEFDRRFRSAPDPQVASPIATAGFFDLDGDGLNDITKLHRMIAKNGGTNIACETGRGQIVGSMTPDTKYLVVGEISEPERKTHPLLIRARKLGVKQISIRDLLNDLGVRGSARIERLDSRIGESF